MQREGSDEEREGAWGLVTVKGQLRRRMTQRGMGAFSPLFAGVRYLSHTSPRNY